MQPYLFPYLGYYQLVYAVDKHVFYDDVNFIKRGYINRNNILVAGKPQRFTVPVLGATQNKKINEIEFSQNITKILKTIRLAYSKSPYFKEIYPIIEQVLTQPNRAVTSICQASIALVFDYLGINKEFFVSSELDYDREQSSADKLISITKLLQCKYYINSPGGVKLYDKLYFLKQGVELLFIRMTADSYNQGQKVFVPCLSMIDVLMWNSKEMVAKLLQQYELF